MMAEITVRVIEELLGKEPSGDGRTFTRLSSYESAGGDAIVFAQDEASLGLALGSAAGLILAPLAAAGCGDVRVLAVRDPNQRPVFIYEVDLATGAHLGGSNGIASGSKPVRDIAIVTR